MTISSPVIIVSVMFSTAILFVINVYCFGIFQLTLCLPHFTWISCTYMMATRMLIAFSDQHYAAFW